MNRKQFFTVLIVMSLIGCKKKETGYFFISNGSYDEPEIKLTLIVDTDTIFNKKAKYTNIAPDLQYMETYEVQQGLHLVKVIEDNHNLIKIDTIDFTDDRWIFISYQFEAEPDTSEINNFKKSNEEILKLHPEFINTMRRGREPEIIIHVMDKEPIHH